MQIFTSRYYNKAVATGEYVPVGISQGNARFLKYSPIYLKALAPSWAMVKMTDKEAYKRAYLKQLDDLGLAKIQRMLELAADGKPVVLLCFEDLRKPEEWCHRTMFAEWYEERTGEKIHELTEEADNRKKPKKLQTALF
jgi:uncharacterized protein (DUF488 family)